MVEQEKEHFLQNYDQDLKETKYFRLVRQKTSVEQIYA